MEEYVHDSSTQQQQQEMPAVSYIDIDKPRYDQSRYVGRVRHFFHLTNPLNLLATNEQLEQAKKLIENYRQTRVLPKKIDENDLWRAKYLVESAYHPCTKEKMFIFGRMSAQVPCSLLITAGMLTFYKTTGGTVLWQWINQSFNATVNYTNRSGDKPISIERIACSYLIAASSATGTALYLNYLVRKSHPLIGRFVPFAAVAVANCLNIPFMRSSEIQHGIQLYNDKNEQIGTSSEVAKRAIGQVVLSRTCMRVAPMIIPPLILYFAEKHRALPKSNRLVYFMCQFLLIGSCLSLSTPMCCAIFPQYGSVAIRRLENETQQKLEILGYGSNDTVWYNKGL